MSGTRSTRPDALRHRAALFARCCVSLSSFTGTHGLDMAFATAIDCRTDCVSRVQVSK